MIHTPLDLETTQEVNNDLGTATGTVPAATYSELTSLLGVQ
jgi:hypothetical protein